MSTSTNNDIPEQLTFSSYPSGNHKGKRQHFIIVGAGIIGVCIAFYLTRHPNFDPENDYITILESKRVAGGASGKAGGLLALWAFPQQIVPLSFQLHQDLATEFNGEKEWGYRRLTTISVEGDISDSNLKKISKVTAAAASAAAANANANASDPASPEDLKSPVSVTSNDDESDQNEIINSSSSSISDSHNLDSNPETPKSRSTTTIKKNSITIESQNSVSNPSLPENLKWIDKEVINEWNHLGNENTTAQVHPYQFTTFMLKQCINTKCVELLIGKVEDIIIDENTGDCRGVIYTPTSAKLNNNNNDTNNKTNNNSSNTTDTVELYGDKTILAIGPWTSKILPDCPISGLRAHSITIQPTQVEDISPYAIFTELKLNNKKFVSPEMYARKDEVYVCGEGDSSVPIPETTDDVEIVAAKCDELFNYISKLSTNLSNGKVLKRQACYLPVLDIPSSSGPLIGETNVESLYLASGHSCWGINNAPATGLLLSELLLDGEVKSCDISALDPSLYFDASLFYADDSEEEEDDGDEEDDEEEEQDSEEDSEEYDEEEEDSDEDSDE